MTAPEPLVGEHGLHEVLAVVEAAVDGNVVHVRRRHRRHLATLHVGDTAARVQHEDVERVAVAARLDGRRTGVAGGGADDRDPLAAPGQFVVEEPAHELQGDVLEGQGRPVEQFHQPEAPVLVEWDEGRHVGMIEGGVGLGGELLERLPVDLALHERPHDLCGGGGVGGGPGGVAGGRRRIAWRNRSGAGPRRPVLARWREGGPRLRDVEASVCCQACEEDVGEGQFRGLAAGGDVVEAHSSAITRSTLPTCRTASR